MRVSWSNRVSSFGCHKLVDFIFFNCAKKEQLQGGIQMLSYWGGLAAIVIMMLVSLVILFVCWDEIKGAFKLMFVFMIIAFSINIESTFQNIKTRQDINELEARNEALERQLKQIDPWPNKGFPVSQKEPLAIITFSNVTYLLIINCE